MTEMSHDEIVDALLARVRTTDAREVAGDFLATLAQTGGHDRTLRGFAYATSFPAHVFQASPGMFSYQCAVCGMSEREDPEADGAPDPARSLRDLDALASRSAVRPAAADVARFGRVLDALADLPADARGTDLERAWKGLIPRSNGYSRAAIIQTLGVCSILSTVDHPGSWTRWVGFDESSAAPNLKTELGPPAGFWRRSDGVNRGALDLLFPQEGLPRERFSRESRPPRIIEARGVTIPRAKRSKKPGLEVVPGDVLAFERHAGWLVGVVLGRHDEGDRAWPIIELFQGVWPALPATPEALVGRPAWAARPYREEPHWRRDPLAIDGLELFGSVWPERLERVARGAERPRAENRGPAPSGYRVVLPRNVLYMLKTVENQPPGPP
jgi:hypothetical protein